jgi:hypothetical protein
MSRNFQRGFLMILVGNRTKVVQSPALQGFLFAIIWLLVTNVTIYFIYVRSVEAVKEEIRDGLLRNVSVAATTIDGDKHRLFTAKTSPNDPVYLAFIRNMEEIRQAAKDVRYLYTNIVQDGDIYFIANGSPQNDNDNDGQPDVAPQLMDPYPDAGNALKEALTTESPRVDREPYTDIWGTFYSAYAPFKDSKGEVVGTLGMDLELTTLQQRLQPIGTAAQRAAFTSGILAILFGVAVWFFRSRNGILKAISSRAEKGLRAVEDERDKERIATAIQLEAVAQRIVNVPREAQDQYAEALLRYAEARKGSLSNDTENFEPLEIIGSCLTEAVSLEVAPLVPSLVFGNPNELKNILHGLCFSPFSNNLLGSLSQVSIGIENEQLNTLDLLMTFRFQARSSSNLSGAQLLEEREHPEHVFDEESLQFATCCAQVRALKGAITHRDMGSNIEVVVVSLPYEKFRENS